MCTPIRFKLAVLTSIALLYILFTLDSWAAQPSFSLPAHAKEYATEGETIKRDLNDGDIAGIQELYQ